METLASAAVRALKRVDLPTLGRPIIPTERMKKLTPNCSTADRVAPKSGLYQIRPTDKAVATHLSL